MFIPLRTNRPPKRRPIVTELLVVLNLLVYLAGHVLEWRGVMDRASFIDFGHLSRGDFHAWQLVTYQFLHDPRGIAHIAFNLLFLWVFGAAVESRLGRLGFVIFYVAGGAVAGLAHMLVSPRPVIGASGAIAGLTGAFLALFPRSRIQVLLIFFIIGIYSIPAMWFIGLYFALDLLRQTASFMGLDRGGVAYMAHLAGYVYGFGVAFGLLATRILKHEEYDIFYLLKQWRRRSAFRAAARQRPGGPWDAPSADTGSQLQKQTRKQRPLSAEQVEEARERAAISRLIESHELPAAAAAYRELLTRSPNASLPPDQQLDIANQLQANGDTQIAARAYELLLERSPAHHSVPEVKLILGLLYVRDLGQVERGLRLVREAKTTLRSPSQLALADRLLGEPG